MDQILDFFIWRPHTLHEVGSPQRNLSRWHHMRLRFPLEHVVGFWGSNSVKPVNCCVVWFWGSTTKILMGTVRTPHPWHVPHRPNHVDDIWSTSPCPCVCHCSQVSVVMATHLASLGPRSRPNVRPSSLLIAWHEPIWTSSLTIVSRLHTCT